MRRGLNIYLKRFQYRNAETQDLWTALEEASEKKVGRVMSTWTQQRGFPIIIVTFCTL